MTRDDQVWPKRVSGESIQCIHTGNIIRLRTRDRTSIADCCPHNGRHTILVTQSDDMPKLMDRNPLKVLSTEKGAGRVRPVIDGPLIV